MEDSSSSIDEETLYGCPLCKKTFQTITALYNHSLNHRPDQHLVCQCSRAYSTISALNQHKNAHKCHRCQKSFCERLHLSNHLKLHKGSRDKLFKCVQCSKSFTDISVLKRHQARVHFKVGGIQCKVCLEIFKDLSLFNNHLKTHKISKTKGDNSHDCSFCEKHFSCKEDLEKHLRRHAKEKPAFSDKCDSSFSKKTELDNHISLVHSGEKHKCELCPMSFAYRSRLNIHRGIVHGEDPEGQLKLTCIFCSIVLRSKCYLDIHLRGHLQEKPYFCKDCDKCFATARSRKKHSRNVHGNENSPKSGLCEKAFLGESGLERHALNVHLKVENEQTI